nr:YeeE/YedE thiosulfate transporter family protein [uncultured Tolumonas sp.]
MYNFTPWSSLLGGLLIGLAALILLWGKGRVAGYSGIIAGLFSAADNKHWRILFLAGTTLGASLATYALHLQVAKLEVSPMLLLAGLLVGVGSRLANGCTSGHGICGIGRFSIRSLVATGLFIFSGAFIVAMTH